MNSVRLRKLLVLDFMCAFMGAVIYFAAYYFLTETLFMPAGLVRAQAAANCLYGIFGLFIFATRKEGLFKILIMMNFAYAGLCLMLAIVLLWKELQWGALILLLEGLLIFSLAWFELKASAEN